MVHLLKKRQITSEIVDLGRKIFKICSANGKK